MKIKTQAKLLIAFLTLSMILGVFALTIGTVRADKGDTIIVFPSGGDDTVAIQNAFDTAGPGDTIKLTKGQYRTNNIIVEDFSGRFKGAGMDLTTIDVYDEVTPDPINDIIALFKFDGGDIHISDLCFDISPDTPYLDDIMWFTGTVNSKITHVKFIGHHGTYEDPYAPGIFWNVYTAISIAGMPEIPDGYPTGKHSITKCEFDSVVIGIETWGLVDGELKIGGKRSGNTFTGGSLGIRMWNTVNSKIEISHNYIESLIRACIYVIQLFDPDLWPASWPIMSSEWSITHNSLYTFFGADALILYDFYTDYGSWEPSIEAEISHNRITLNNEMWGGMVIIGVDDALISKNIITGVGDYGIDSWFCNNLKILGNRIQIDARGTIGNDWYLFYGMSLWFGADNVIALNKISHKEADGLFVESSNENLILGNLIKDNGGYGLFMEASNDNHIIANVFHNNFLGNIFDDGTNIYSRNREK